MRSVYGKFAAFFFGDFQIFSKKKLGNKVGLESMETKGYLPCDEVEPLGGWPDLMD
jgi:hypothetical protein